MLTSLLPFLGHASNKLAVGATIPPFNARIRMDWVVDLQKVGEKGYLLVYFIQGQHPGAPSRAVPCETTGRNFRNRASKSSG